MGIFGWYATLKIWKKRSRRKKLYLLEKRLHYPIFNGSRVNKVRAFEVAIFHVKTSEALQLVQARVAFTPGITLSLLYRMEKIPFLMMIDA
jgi:hypothetical protein